MNCSSCGKGVRPSDLYCTHCGAKLTKHDEVTTFTDSPSEGKSIAITEIGEMIMSGVELRIAMLPNNAAGRATSSILSCICEPDWLGNISLALAGKMTDALSDGKLHSTGMCNNRIYVLMYTLPCSPEHTLKTIYKDGYTNYIANAVGDWLSDSLTNVTTLLHIQLFAVNNSLLSLHITVFPINPQGPSMVVFPSELLTVNDRDNLALLGIKR